MTSEAIEIVESVASILAELLADERRPDGRFCSVCFIGFPRLLEQGGEPAIPVLQTQHHGFLDACMRNLCVPLTTSQKVALRSRLQNHIVRCRRIKGKPHSDELRDSDHGHIDDALELFHSMLCGVLVACLYGFDRRSGDRPRVQPPVNRASSAHKPFRSAKGLWPTSVDQLFPFSPERTVESIIESCCSFANRGGLVLLNALLQLVRPRIWDIILQPSNRHRLSWVISTTLLLGVPGGYETLSPDPRLAPPGCTVPAHWRQASWLRDGAGMQAAATLLCTLRRGNYAHPDDGLRFCGAHGELLGPAIRAALDHCGTDDLKVGARGTFVYYLHTLERGAQTPVARMLDGELEPAVEREPRGRIVLGIVRLAMNWLPRDRRCAGPQCARTMLDRFDEADKPLSTCARCQRVRYCSKACQQRDWKAGQPVPHKLLCPIIAQLRAGENMDEKQFAQLVQRSGFSDAQMVVVGKWALSRGQVMRDHLAQYLILSSKDPSLSELP